MTPHIEASTDEIADIVFLPGDPLRAKWTAETFLSDLQCYNQVRNMLMCFRDQPGLPSRCSNTE